MTGPRGRQARRVALPRAPVADAAQLLAGSTPLYVTVATELAAAILDGRRPVGTLLPTEQELCQSFGVSRSTVRQALRRLAELGLVAGAQGVGTRVIADQPRGQYVLAIRSVTDVMGYAERARLDIRTRSSVTADAALAARLGCEPGSRWIHVAGLRRPAGGRDTVIAICDLYVAEQFRDVAESDDLAATPAYRLIAGRRGIAVEAVEQVIGAITLDAAQAEVLGVAPGSPGLHIRRQFFTAAGMLIEATTNIHAAADQFVYTLRLGAPGEG
ncbi:GntR family transcriptional regulator [Plastoroseomonas arctica]|uniref:GntR family transcriptional regulator n=1 Tax=Plastoroseomonas arctica TaxID=1509237 RepID=A0AAF1K5D2_9PROT|nr:GntR family transcriptional regulator [Plastoroseomonas arctica]MBR0656319.1 GntR family transcriptional regulator [Plastoroseomonas arctica]